MARRYFQLSPQIGSTTSQTPSIIVNHGPKQKDPLTGPGLDQSQSSTPSVAANTATSSSSSYTEPATSRVTAGSETPTTADEEEELILSAIERDILDLFSDEYCNKHLVYSIIETVLIKLLPEISEQGVSEMMAERGVR